jgi:hypothetical protein
MDGVRVDETASVRRGSETWRVLRAHFASFIETHASASFRIFLWRGPDAARLWLAIRDGLETNPE